MAVMVEVVTIEHLFLWVSGKLSVSAIFTSIIRCYFVGPSHKPFSHMACSHSRLPAWIGLILTTLPGCNGLSTRLLLHRSPSLACLSSIRSLSSLE